MRDTFNPIYKQIYLCKELSVPVGLGIQSQLQKEKERKRQKIECTPSAVRDTFNPIHTFRYRQIYLCKELSVSVGLAREILSDLPLQGAVCPGQSCTEVSVPVSLDSCPWNKSHKEKERERQKVRARLMQHLLQ